MKVKVNKNITQHLEEIKECYHESRAVKKGDFTVLIDPFKVIKLDEVIADACYIAELKTAATSVPLLRKNNDLYSLQQSMGLSHSDNPYIKEFVKFLKKSMQPFLEEIFGYKFSETISITASLYRDGDVLLCHDDKCEDRCVAFVYYLTSISENCGGSFDMFQHDDSGQPSHIITSLPPQCNSFICFEVGNYTYHQVSEVTSPTDERLSINGWFHCERALSIVPLKYKDPLPPLQHQVLFEGLVMLDEFMNTIHYTPSYIDQVRGTFSQESHILLPNFFTKSFFSLCKSSLEVNNIKWLTLGPANRRKYQVADLKSVKGPLNMLVNYIKSPLFVSYLKSITGLDLEPKAGNVNAFSSKMILELQKWTPGCYTMATDNDCFFEHDGLDIYFFFKVNGQEDNEVDHGGSIVYLDASDDHSESDTELLTIDPVNNSMCSVYRTSDTVRFTKYINHKFLGVYYCLAATFYEADHKF